MQTKKAKLLTPSLKILSYPEYTHRLISEDSDLRSVWYTRKCLLFWCATKLLGALLGPRRRKMQGILQFATDISFIVISNTNNTKLMSYLNTHDFG